MTADLTDARGKTVNLALVVVAQVLALALWFAGTAAGPDMAHGHPKPWCRFSGAADGAVQAGFVVGTLVSAALALADRFDPRRLFATSAVAGAGANALIMVLVLPLGSAAVLIMRLVTGIALAGVYPVGMKLAVGWASQVDVGLVVGLLVGGLTLGSALPHLVNALSGLSWHVTLSAASLAAVLAAALVWFIRLGPRHTAGQAFRPSDAAEIWRNPGTRLATLGYLGHMWELYAMCAWVGAYLAASFAAHGSAAAPGSASLATFAVFATGAIGCVAAGWLADRLGRVQVTIGAMAISAACCLLSGWAFGQDPALTVTLCLIWGIAAVADSAQFSACVAELAKPGLTGTMLTVQTSLGFLLTLVPVQAMPFMVAGLGWGGAFAVLAIGPALGCLAMRRLGRLQCPSG